MTTGGICAGDFYTFEPDINFRKEIPLRLEAFLVRAKIAAYAGGGEGGEVVLADGGREMAYAEGGYRYRDRYYGWNPFGGEEVVFQAGKAVWTMNYYGLVFSEVVPAGEVYAFLQKAMGRVAEDRPFRGPDSFLEGDFEYRDESRGTAERFTGVERIFHRGREVYRLDYHGGRIREK
jgi:hypothetical protein